MSAISSSPGLQQRHSEQYGSPRQGALVHMHNVAELVVLVYYTVPGQQYWQCGCAYYKCTRVGSFRIMASRATMQIVICLGPDDSYLEKKLLVQLARRVLLVL